MKSVKGKHVVITGGSSGIGLACARRFVTEGANVTIMARDPMKLARAKEELDNLAMDVGGADSSFCQPPEVRTHSVDAADAAAVKLAISSAEKEQPIDVLVCNAGLVRTGHAEDLTAAEVQQQVNTNLLGSIYPVQAVLPNMKARAAAGEEPGAIVFMCSLSALAYWYGASVYTATKYAIRGFAEAIRMELLPYHITVSCICPGFTETPLLEDAEASSQYVTQMMRIACFYDRQNLEDPNQIAKHTVGAVLSGEFLVTTTMRLFPVSVLCMSRGAFPSYNILLWLWESLSIPVHRFGSFFVQWAIFMAVHRFHKRYFAAKVQ